jgi:hypothetical protein
MQSREFHTGLSVGFKFSFAYSRGFAADSNSFQSPVFAKRGEASLLRVAQSNTLH